MLTITELNALPSDQFIEIVGPTFEHSPWIAERTYAARPFQSVSDLHARLCETVRHAMQDEQIGLIAAHPDLVGRAARAGTLTPESTHEQAAAGLGGLSAEEIEQFTTFNAAYRSRFGFPFVICARENKKDIILAAFPRRLRNDRNTEIGTALDEIFKIAWLRLADRISD